jgi:hypothetical protein
VITVARGYLPSWKPNAAGADLDQYRLRRLQLRRVDRPECGEAGEAERGQAFEQSLRLHFRTAKLCVYAERRDHRRAASVAWFSSNVHTNALLVQQLYVTHYYE